MIPSLSLLMMPLQMQPDLIQLAFVSVAAHCWLVLSLMSARTPRSLSAILLFSHVDPNLFRDLWLCLSPCKTLHFYSLNLRQFLLDYCGSLSRSLCKVALHFERSTSPTWFTIISMVGGGTLNPVVQIIYLLNSTEARINHQGTWLVTGCLPRLQQLITTLWL